MSQPARILLDTERTISPISPLLFSGFAEHMGRTIYEGIYDPASPHADERGFRKDVIAALRELHYRAIRYPGGNFLSGYRWQDGVGPKDQRPRRRDLAWQSIETNQFGTNEFIAWCREIGAQPMMGVNMGTGTIQDAADLVEYCNAPAGTKYSDLRSAHGFTQPHGVHYWCLGNEMDGPWQIGHLDAPAYGAKAREAGKMMRWQDPSIELILCGSSGIGMPTFPEWDRIALEMTWEQVNYHSMHYYAVNEPDDTASFLALPVEFEAFVDTLSGVLRYVKAQQRSKHDVYLSWDEWNVWYKARQQKDMEGGWQEAPHLIEEVYNLEDALLAAEWMNVFLRRADVLKIACLAQAVNVIAPILTTREALLKQTIFYPFALYSRLARGASLDLVVNAPLVSTARFGDVPVVDVAASFDEENRRVAVFVVNRSLTDTVPVQIEWQNQAPRAFGDCWQIAGDDPKAANTFEQPNRIVPRSISAPVADGQVTTFHVPPLSFAVLEAELTGAPL
ncbi:MAG: alpha-N-arabinofuranosidase [Anaerolineae bacterium]